MTPATPRIPPSPPRAPRKTPPWIYVLSGIGGGLLFVLAVQLWLAGRAEPEAPAAPLRPLRFQDVPEREAISLFLAPGDDDADGHPSVAVKLGDRTWYLSHPDPGSSITEKTAAWNRFAAGYERVSAGIRDAVGRIQEAEPDRRIGVIRTLGDELEVPDSVIEFVQEAFAEADVEQVVVAPLLPGRP